MGVAGGFFLKVRSQSPVALISTTIYCRPTTNDVKVLGSIPKLEVTPGTFYNQVKLEDMYKEGTIKNSNTYKYRNTYFVSGVVLRLYVG